MRMFALFQEGSTEGAMEEEFLTVKEVAECLRVSPKTIYRRVKQGRLKVYSARKRLYFKRKDISTLLRW